jgi:hypothetical protein
MERVMYDLHRDKVLVDGPPGRITSMHNGVGGVYHESPSQP